MAGGAKFFGGHGNIRITFFGIQVNFLLDIAAMHHARFRQRGHRPGFRAGRLILGSLCRGGALRRHLQETGVVSFREQALLLLIREN